MPRFGIFLIQNEHLEGCGLTYFLTNEFGRGAKMPAELDTWGPADLAGGFADPNALRLHRGCRGRPVSGLMPTRCAIAALPLGSAA